MALVFQSLNSANATGPGAENFFDTPKSTITMQSTFTGSVGEATVYLEVTIDGTNWVPLGHATSPNVLTNSTGVAVIGIRANITDLSGGSDVNATIAAT